MYIMSNHYVIRIYNCRPDSYDFYRGYFETSFKLLTDSTSLHDPEFQVNLEK